MTDNTERASFLEGCIQDGLDRLCGDAGAGLVRAYWIRLLEDPRNVIREILCRFLAEGMPPGAARNLVRALIGLAVDVTNPWVATSYLRKLVGVLPLSVEFLGGDFSALSPLTHYERCRADYRPFVPDASVDGLSRLRAEYEELKLRTLSLIGEPSPYAGIAAEVGSRLTDFLERVLAEIIPLIWEDLGVPREGGASIFFRRLKTFASDVDLFYRGPRAEEVIVRLAKYMHFLGFRFDLRIACQIAEEVRRGVEYTERSFGGINFMDDFFFSGGLVGFNGGAGGPVPAGGLRWVEPHAKRVLVYSYLCEQLDIWNRKVPFPSLTLTDRSFKLLYFRTITNLIFCLCARFGAHYSYEGHGPVRALDGRLSTEELAMLENGLSLVNQTRNVYQRNTLRKSESGGAVRVSDLLSVGETLAAQGVPDIGEEFLRLGAGLEKMRRDHLSGYDPDRLSARELAAKPDVGASAKAQSFSKYVEGYRSIVRSTFGAP